MNLIVCLHDNPLNGQEFDPLLPLLKEQGFQAVVHKRPVQGSKLEPLLQSINATAKVSGGGPFSLVAYSWGAYLALAYLKRYPENLKSLVLLNPIVVADSRDDRPSKALLSTPLLSSLVLRWRCRSLASIFLKKRFAPQDAPVDVRSSVEPFLSQGQIWRGEAAYHNLLREKPLVPNFEGISVPVKVIFGEEDCVAPKEEQLFVLGKLQNMRTVTIPGAGHALPWTHASQISHEIIAV